MLAFQASHHGDRFSIWCLGIVAINETTTPTTNPSALASTCDVIDVMGTTNPNIRSSISP